MHYVKQTIMAPPDGNCFAACLASVLGLPLDDVPSLTAPDGVWAKALFEFLEPYDLTFHYIAYSKFFDRGTWILSAEVDDGKSTHCVVVTDGKVVWDPSPRPRVLGKWIGMIVLAPLDPHIARLSFDLYRQKRQL
jgi:hypothetical protein